jgi:hypothetical protein
MSLSRLRELCQHGLAVKGISDDRINKRLQEELKDVEVNKEVDYFLDLYDRKVRYAKNEFNSAIPYALGIVRDIDLEKEAEYSSPEWP